MKKYFLLATTALLLGANVANAEVMEDGKVTMQVSATIKDMGLRVDDSYGVNDVELGTILIDRAKQADASSVEDFALAYINPETGALEGRGPAFVAYEGGHQRGSFKMAGTNYNDLTPYLANADAEGYETYGMNGIQMECGAWNTTGNAYFVPQYNVEYESDGSVGGGSAIIYVGGTLYGTLNSDKQGTINCTGSLEIMLETSGYE